MTVILETPRLRLRELTPGDLDAVSPMLAHPEVMRFWPRPFTRDEAAEWVRRQLDRYAEFGHGYWLAEERATGEPVGQYGLLPLPPDLTAQGLDGPNLGYITHRPYWRRGYALEAAAACLDLALGPDRPHWRRVYATIRPENAPSRAVALALGMTLVPGRRAVLAGLEHEVYVKTAGG
jgi:RimJ/RimL family protein N-acetyltransferase